MPMNFFGRTTIMNFGIKKQRVWMSIHLEKKERVEVEDESVEEDVIEKKIKGVMWWVVLWVDY
jgi:hypothetical protein